MLKALGTIIAIFLPFSASADILNGPIVPRCTGVKGFADACNFCDLIQLFNNGVRFAVAFSVIVATLMFVYAGILYFSASARQDNIKKAHGIFSRVFVGLVLVLAAWLIIDVVMKTLAGDTGNGGRVWNDIQCSGIVVSTGGVAPTRNVPPGTVTPGTGATGTPNPNDNFSRNCDPRLIRLVNLAHRYSVAPFVVNNCGRAGSTTAVNSQHLCGTAVDVWPVVNGVPDPTGKTGPPPNANYSAINSAFARASQELGIPYRWGGASSTFLGGNRYDSEHFDLGIACSAPNRAI
jgi:hypothetical protein